MIIWAKQLKTAFGASFLWLICFIYFTQVLFFICVCVLAKSGGFIPKCESIVFPLLMPFLGVGDLCIPSFGFRGQGFRSFAWTTVSYQLKDKLKLSPSASQFVSSIAFFPWSIKPLYGPMSWFFLEHVTVPNLSTVMFYYQTEFLNLEASFLGTARVVGWLGLMLGTFIYNKYFKKMKLRRILVSAHIGLSLLSLLDIVLVVSNECYLRNIR